jgi:hypothetical protein
LFKTKCPKGPLEKAAAQSVGVGWSKVCKMAQKKKFKDVISQKRSFNHKKISQKEKKSFHFPPKADLYCGLENGLCFL